MGPVTHDPPFCQLYQLQDGTYGINDLADFWETMAEESEYKARARDRAESGKAGTP